MAKVSFLFGLFRAFVDEEAHDEYTDGDEYVEYLVAVGLYLQDELVLGNDGVESVSDGGQHDVPAHGTQRGEEDKLRELHAGQTGGYGDELTHGRDESADKGRYAAVLVEVAFGRLYLALVEQAHVAHAAVGKLVDERTAYPEGQVVVYDGTYIGTEGTEEDNQIHIQFAIGSFVGGGYNHDFGGEGDKRTLDHHKESDGPIIDIIETPLYER